MFGRSASRTTIAGSRIRSRRTISSRTLGEAVAVSASSRGEPSVLATEPSAR
jgi:hypothetical protein